jgi:hypothetical protein|nr:MAG TPA: hypothetical protein [Bacteriophage sp.]
MAYKNNQSGISIGGYVPQRIPVRANIEALSQALNKIDERSDKAIQQKSAITNAIGQLKLNAAEDKWKYDYAKRIEQKINDAAQYGDYSRALDVATELAGSSTSSPEVIGRIRANEAYEKKKGEVESLANSGVISGLTKERWLAQNKYAYEDIRDENGNIVGGTDWKAGWDPVKKVDMSRLVTLAGQLAAPVKRATSSTSQRSVSDEQGIGNGGTSTSKGLRSVKTGYSTSSGSSFQRETLTKQKIDEVYNKLFALDPDNMNALIQQFDDVQWKVNQLKDELSTTNDPEKRKTLQNSIDSFSNDIYDANGQPLKVKEYMLSKIGVITKNMAYDNTSVSHTSGSSETRGLTYGTKYALSSGTNTSNITAPLPTLGGTYYSNPGEVNWNVQRDGSYFQQASKSLSENGILN